MRIRLTLLFVIIGVCAFAEPSSYEFTPNVKKAYDEILSLKFKSATKYIQEEKSANPKNVAVHFVEDYMDFFKVFINEDKSEFQQLFPNRQKRIDLIKSADKDSPYYLYMQAEIHLHWALLRLKFEQNFQAALEVRKAFKQLESNQEKFPDFIANKKSLGILHAMIETIPDKYRKLAKLVGMTGSIEQGLSEIKEVIKYSQTNEFLFDEETLVMYSFLLLYLGNQGEEAWEEIHKADLDAENNPLAAFVLANMSMSTGRNDQAISILENRPSGDEFHPFHYLDFTLGLAKLYRGDVDADVHLKKYVRNHKGQNFIKEAYQKLAWHALLNAGENEYYQYMGLIKVHGNAIVDEDKKALQEATYGPKPDKTLLKARLLFDGGYLDKAERVLLVKTVSDFEVLRSKIEYNYRFGRIYHKMGRTNEAIDYYNTSIQLGESHPFYFACNAALQLGILYEDQNDFEKATENYKRCISMHPSEYRTSLHQKAKAGLSRVRSR